jgi:DNA-binding LacI/PurR family transcriptional regulator
MTDPLPPRIAQVQSEANVTIDDVARAAGVSVSTVSRILNNKPDVSVATRQRVLKVIADLGYVPHGPAQSLAGGKSRTIALLFPQEYAGLTQLELDFFIGAAAAATQQNFFFNLMTGELTPNSLLALYRSGQVDGVILMQIQMHDWRVELLRSHNLPFVMIGRCEDNHGLSFIDLNFEAAIVMAYEHLFNLGHRHIGFVARPGFMREKNLGPAIRTLAGFEKACQRFTVTPIFRETMPTLQDAFEATLDMIDQDPVLTAIVTVNGASAVGIIRALESQGLRVPADFSVVAVATSKITQLITPPLTAIDFPTDTMGFRAARMLIKQLQRPAPHIDQELLVPQLMIRQSTAHARP